jgi:hypothetical protein
MNRLQNDIGRKPADKPRVYLDQLITIDDLSDFKRQLLFEIKSLFKEHHGQPMKQWIKSNEVRKLLNISPGTLQNMRVKGILPFTRIGGVIFHNFEDIHRMLESKKLNAE